jgi:two-component system nitrogen regulation sensor histidine kinase GlnL
MTMPRSRVKDNKPAKASSQAASSDFVDNLPVAWLSVDPVDTITMLNTQAEALLGLSAKLIEGAALDDVFGVASEIEGLVQRARRSGARLIAHRVALTSPRATHPFVTVCLSVDMATRCVNLVLTQSEPEQPSGGVFAQSIKTLARSLAHEVKNPLAGLVGAAQLLLRGAREDQITLLTLIRDEGRRIGRIADRFASLDAYGAPELVAGNVHVAINKAISLFSAQELGNIDIQFDFDPSVPDALFDEDHIAAALINLLKNAVEALAMPSRSENKKGQITVATRYRSGVRLVGGGGMSGGIELVVEDNGPGIGPRVRERIFEPFLTTKRGGSGVGLSVVAEIVRAHGGQIEVRSKPGSTRFTLLIPPAQAQEAVVL